jgi:hypothetical protein
MFQIKVIEENKTHNSYPITFFFFENRAVYEIMWKSVAERGRPQMTMWCISITCGIPKATNTHTHTHTHSDCVILIAFPLQQLFTESSSLLCYTYIASLVVFCVYFVGTGIT